MTASRTAGRRAQSPRPAVRGRVLEPRRPRLRRRPPGLERHDRQAAGGHRAGRGTEDVAPDDRPRPRDRPSARDPGRAATTWPATAPWTAGSSWTWAGSRGRGRPGAPGPGRGGGDARGHRSGDRAVRARRADRRRVGDRDRGPHARRRRRLAHAPVRPDDRQPRRARTWSSRPGSGSARATTSTRPVLGPARRGRQLRGRHLLHLPRPPARPRRLRRHARLRAPPLGGGASRAWRSGRPARRTRSPRSSRSWSRRPTGSWATGS